MNEEIPNYHVPGTRCVNCSKEMPIASPVAGGRAPRPGDIGICIHCRHLQVYGDDMQFRQLTDSEVVEVAGDEEIVLAMNMLGGFDEWCKQRKE